MITTLFFSSQAQQPSYYLLGAEELAEVDIYSIEQDKNAFIWLSTDDGLLKYDGYNFYNIKNTTAKSNALFGLIKDNAGDIFCTNLNGQIFKIKNDSLFLFFEIPDSLLSNLIHFNFDNKNQLVFCTNNYYVVDKNADIHLLFPSEYGSNRIAKTQQGELIFVNFLAKQFAYYKDDKVYAIKQLDFHATYPFITKNKFYLAAPFNAHVYQQNNKEWVKINFEKKEELLTNIIEFYSINDSLLSFRHKNRGITFYKDNGALQYSNTRLFPKYRISFVLMDKEGNLWLPTLSKGIIIVPNMEVIDYNNHPILKEDDIKSITSDHEGNVYAAGLNGIIYRINAQKVEVFNHQNIDINFLKFNPYTKFLFSNSRIVPIHEEKEKLVNVPAAKDICILDSAHFYVATNGGVLLFSQDNTKLGKFTPKLLSKIRTNCLTYDKKRKELWVGSTKGLQVIADTKNRFIRYQQQQILARDIEYIRDEIWVSTDNDGILIFKDGFFSRRFEFAPQKNIHKLVYKDQKLFFSSSQGLHIYNFKTQTTANLSKAEGLLSNKIIDFEPVGNLIWLISPNGLQCINQDAIVKNNIQPIVKWTSVLVNNESVLEANDQVFGYLQNQFEFHFVAAAFRHQGTLTYQYQLIGLNDTPWQEASYKNNVVKFSALSHGNYTFNVKAINESGLESATISYSFQINPPFWLTWWFFALCGFTLMLLIIVFLAIRINIIKKRLTLEKQLKTSEITAIKAQMNPHFMFNALNSIQDLIMLKDVRSSNVYLGKFADLMRKTLEFSSENFISLTEEIEILELYLELEKLRFGDSFTMSINCEISNNKLQELQIPSMLLQPYVENAVKHGLLHKEGAKELVINFYLKNSTLVCEIIDNGIGRQKSMEIKARREKSYPSFSTQANKKRIDLIRESTNKKISLNIIDLFENDKPAGTKVVFEFE